MRNTTGPYWSAARHLVETMGLEAAYLYAFEMSHPYMSFGADPDPHARLAWGKVAARIRWLYSEREHERRVEAREALFRRGRRGIEVRT